MLPDKKNLPIHLLHVVWHSPKCASISCLLSFLMNSITSVEMASGIVDMQLVFIFGAPATGKLTVARELATLTRYKLFHNHLTVDLVGSLFEFGSPPFTRLREEIWLAAFRESAIENLSLIFTFAPERTVSDHFISDVLEMMQGNNGRVTFVKLVCDDAELERRIENISRTKFGKLSSLELYRSLKAANVFNSPAMPEPDISLDTTSALPSLI